MKVRLVRYVILAGLAGAAACGDDPVASGDMLSQAEAEALAGVVMTTVVSTTSDVDTEPATTAPRAPSLAPFSYTSSVETVAPCPLGGELALAGSVSVSGDDVSGVQSLEYSMTHAHSGCMAQAEDGRVFTLTGSPNVVVDVMMEAVDETSMSIDGSIVGAVAWKLEDREGTCSISLEFDATVGDASLSMNVAGAVCGTTVTEALTIG